jgi:hypothetical protein
LVEEVESRVGQLNGKYATLLGSPIHFIHGSIPFFRLIAEHGATWRAPGKNQWERLDNNVSYAWKEKLLPILQIYECSSKTITKSFYVLAMTYRTRACLISMSRAC